MDYLYPCVLATLIAIYMRYKNLDNQVIGIVLAGLALYYFHAFSADWQYFCHDLEAHQQYVKFIADHWRIPSLPDTFGQDGTSSWSESLYAAYRQPPFYYIIAGLFFDAARYLGSPNPWRAVQDWSMTCFMGFIVLSVLTLRQIINARSFAFYSAVLLLVFWPVGVTMGGRISNDVLMYACTAGTLYFLVRWQQHFDHRELFWALLWCGFAILAKNASITWGLIIACFTFYSLLRKYFPLRSLFRKDLFFAALFVGCCSFITYWHGWIFHNSILIHNTSGEKLKVAYLWRTYLTFDFPLYFHSILSIHPGFQVVWSNDYPFWNFFIRTLAFDEMEWKAYAIQVQLTLILFFMLFSIAFFYVYAGVRLRQEYRLLILLFFAAAGLIGGLIFTRIMIPNPYYSEIRYIYPLITILVSLYGKSMETYRIRNEKIGYVFGVVAMFFVGLSIMLILVQDIA